MEEEEEEIRRKLERIRELEEALRAKKRQLAAATVSSTAAGATAVEGGQLELPQVRKRSSPPACNVSSLKRQLLDVTASSCRLKEAVTADRPQRRSESTPVLPQHKIGSGFILEQCL